MGKAHDPWFELEPSGTGQVGVAFAIESAVRWSLTSPAFEIESGRDGLSLMSLGQAVLASSDASDRLDFERAAIWMSPGGGVAYRGTPKTP